MDGIENNTYINPDNLTKKQFKKWCKKEFGNIRDKLPRAPKNLFMAKGGWIAS